MFWGHRWTEPLQVGFVLCRARQVESVRIISQTDELRKSKRLKFPCAAMAKGFVQVLKLGSAGVTFAG